MLVKQFKRTTLKTLMVYVAVVFLIIGADPRVGWFLAGCVFIGIGEGVRIWAAGHLRKNAEVTTTGPYAYVKNPLYLGTFLLMVGFCVLARNPFLLALGLFVFFFYYAPYKKRREGMRLSNRFGEVWEEYSKRVPDYIPSLFPYPNRGERRWNVRLCVENSEHGTLLAVLVGIFAIVLRFWAG